MCLLEIIRRKSKCWWSGIVMFMAAAGLGAAPQLTIRADHVMVNRFDTSGYLNIYLTNTTDTVAGYQFLLHLNRPDIALFEEAFDTAGTVSSGWDLVHVHSVSGTGLDAKVVGLANDILTPGQGAPIPPGESERLLVSIPFRVQGILDTMTALTAAVTVDPTANNLVFSRTDGSVIGLTLAIVPDTACLRCMYWIGNACQQWQLADGPPCDTLIITLDSIPMLDTLKVVAIPGTITICNRTVYDIDINRDGYPLSVAELVMLMRFVARDTNAIGDSSDADINGDCVIDWADVNMLDSIMFKLPWNPPPELPYRLPCACEHPVLGPCCWQMRGNLDGDFKNLVDLTDLSTLVAYLTGFGPIALKCPDEANVDGLGIIDLSDLSRLVAYLTGIGQAPAQCP